MKVTKFKALIGSLLAVSILSSSQGSCSENFCTNFTQEIAPCSLSRNLVEVKLGYFFFSNSKMRKVYDEGGLDIQLAASYPLCGITDEWDLQAYGSVGYIYLSGKSLNGNQNTTLQLVPVNLGLKPTYAINNDLDYYFAVGPRYFYIHQHNHSSYVYENRSKNGLGFFINTGFNYSLCNNLVLNLFGEYSYGKTHFHSSRSDVYTRSCQIGGYTVGAGLGYAF